MSELRATSSDDLTNPTVKRRKIRKGTHSCWECKRKKIKCNLSSHNLIGPCNECRKRGSPCISQEYPEGVLNASMDTVLGQTGRMCSTSVEQSPKISSNEFTREKHNALTPSSINSVPLLYTLACKSSEPSPSRNKNESLSKVLYEALPSREDIRRICKAGHQSCLLTHELLTLPYDYLEQNGLKTPQNLIITPEHDEHPVIIARYMLWLALFIQHLNSDLSQEIAGLSEALEAVMHRLANTAITHVTSNDNMIGSLEGLECIMLESLYQVNIGNLRRSWVSGRRALSIAQLMGIHRSYAPARYKLLDSKTQCDNQIMWLRIVTLDRQLCLLLGVPQACIDHSMASELRLSFDTPLGQLERLHCVIMSRILERNENKLAYRDLAITKAIDLELQRAARGLPGKWWLVPSLHATATDLEATFWSARRLITQICHYNLLVQLHLPYILYASGISSNNSYSKVTCVHASREVLLRYIPLRNVNRIAYSCKTVDFIALMAAMALLLAHLHSVRDHAGNVLAHQYVSDRAMIEQVQENMEKMNRLSADPLSAQSADLLRRLLDIDGEDENHYISVIAAEPEGDNDLLRGLEAIKESGVDVHIPYFGTIKISSTASTKQHFASAHVHPGEIQTRNRATNIGAEAGIDEGFSGSRSLPSFMALPNAETILNETCLSQSGEQHDRVHQDNLSNFRLSRVTPLPLDSEYPDLAATTEDWAFQGVDMTFFDNIMRSTRDNYQNVDDQTSLLP